MKKHRGKPIVQITHPEIEQYAENHTTDESSDIHKLISSSDDKLEYIDMLSGKLVSQILKMLIRISGAKNILEIGTFTGYSALAMAEAIEEGGRITTIEMNLRYQKIAEEHFAEFDKKGVIKLLKGNAQSLINELDGPFDLIYMDADKLRYAYYFEQSLPLLKEGGLMVIDNVLWDGTVLDPTDHKAEAIANFNKFVADHPEVEQVLLPIRDGLLIAEKLTK